MSANPGGGDYMPDAPAIGFELHKSGCPMIQGYAATCHCRPPASVAQDEAQGPSFAWLSRRAEDLRNNDSLPWPAAFERLQAAVDEAAEWEAGSGARTGAQSEPWYAKHLPADDTEAARLAEVGLPEYLADKDAEIVALWAEVERLRAITKAQGKNVSWMSYHDACAGRDAAGRRAVAAEAALAVRDAQVARVEAVRERVLDRNAMVTEGPLIGRIKVEHWLRTALDDPKESA